MIGVLRSSSVTVRFKEFCDVPSKILNLVDFAWVFFVKLLVQGAVVAKSDVLRIIVIGVVRPFNITHDADDEQRTNCDL